MQDFISYFKNSKKNLVNLLLLAIMVLALPLGVNLVREQQLLKSRAAGDPIKFTGPNVEKRGDKWVAKTPQITLELVSSLGGPSGSAPGGAALSGSGGSGTSGGAGTAGGGSSAGGNQSSSGGSSGGGSGGSLQNGTFQSLVPNGITAEQITAEANQIIGSGNWRTEENQFKLRRNLFEKYFGREGDWLTPQQITKFLDQRTDIGAFVKGKGVEPTSYGIILGEWFPGGSRDTDAQRLLLQIVHEENGQPITTPDQVLAMVGIKEKIISMMGGPEGSRDWPATRFLREWFKIQNKNSPDQNAINALRIMSKMPGQVGFTLQEYPNLPQAFTSSQTTSLPASPQGGPNLMSFLPKGLIGEVKALVPGPAPACDDDVRYCDGDRLIWKHGGYWDGSDCQYAFNDAGPCQCISNCPPPDEICEGDTFNDQCGNTCFGTKQCGGGGGGQCNGSYCFTTNDCDDGGADSFCRRLYGNDAYCDPRNDGPRLNGCIGGGSGGPQCVGTSCFTVNDCQDGDADAFCRNNYGSSAYCDPYNAGPNGNGCRGGATQCDGYYETCWSGSQQGTWWCEKGVPDSGGNCSYSSQLTTRCVKEQGSNEVNVCNVSGIGGPGPGPGPGTGTCTPNSFKPFNKNDCTGQRASCDANAGEFRVFTCKADGSDYVESGSECKTECKTATGGGPGQGGSPGPGGSPPGGGNKPPGGGSPPPGGGGSPPPSGGGTVTTVSFKIAENPDELAGAQEFAYNSEPVVTGFTFRNQTPGDKFVWVEFKASNGRTARHNAQIKLLGPDPRATSCNLDFEGTNAVFNIKGQNFGPEQGSAKTGTNNLQVRDWKDSEVKLIFQNPQSGQSFPVTLTNKDGQTASVQCGSVSGLSLGAKVFCRAPSKHDTDNVDLVLTGVAGSVGVGTSGNVGVGSTAPSQTGPIRQKVKIDKDGNIQNLQSKLAEGAKYRVSLKAPKSLRRTVEIIAGGGITNLQNFVLPVGDIFPLDGGDGKINNFDKSELNRQWIIAQAASGRSGDFNQDDRVNVMDWACMRFDFNKEDEKE